MRPYRNLSGDSGVRAYATGPDFIDVRFASGEVYRYDYASTGRAAVERMKRLAADGRGLSTYIAKNVRERYARKSP